MESETLMARVMYSTVVAKPPGNVNETSLEGRKQRMATSFTTDARAGFPARSMSAFCSKTGGRVSSSTAMRISGWRVPADCTHVERIGLFFCIQDTLSSSYSSVIIGFTGGRFVAVFPSAPAVYRECRTGIYAFWRAFDSERPQIRSPTKTARFGPCSYRKYTYLVENSKAGHVVSEECRLMQRCQLMRLDHDCSTVFLAHRSDDRTYDSADAQTMAAMAIKGEPVQTAARWR